MRRLIALAVALAGAAAGTACGDTPGNSRAAASDGWSKQTRVPGEYLVTLNDDPGPASMEKLRAGNVHIKSVQPNFVYGIRGPGNAR